MHNSNKSLCKVLTAFLQCCIGWFDMRKNDLIKKLQAMSGNPEIMLWNGLVGDFVPIGNIGDADLVKQTKDNYMKIATWREQRDGVQPDTDRLKELEQNYQKVCRYELNRFVTQEDIKSGHYKQKRIMYIDAKLTGKRSMDRQGVIDY